MSLSVPMTFVKPLTTALGPLGYLIKLKIEIKVLKA